MSTRQINQAGRELIQRHEGKRLDVYLDPSPARHPTVGIGHKLTPDELKRWPVGTKLTERQVQDLFTADLKRFESAIAKAVKVALTDNQFAACVSLAFNIGADAFSWSTLLKLLNAGNYTAAAEEFPKWKYAAGQVLPGLVKRRADERELFLSNYSKSQKAGTTQPQKPASSSEPKQGQTFEQWFAGLGVEYFSAAEVTRNTTNTHNGVRNSMPPHELWGNLIPTLRVADELRRRLGVPITITSGYRSPAYNKAMKGASSSQHLRFNALDLKSSAGARKMHAELKRMRDSGMFKGGIGLYVNQNFVHIDTRGTNVDFAG